MSGLAQHTMQGTPLYLSPKIREAYMQFFSGPSTRVAHNVYKSDVYSLGLTIIHAMTLLPPNELAYTNGLEARIEAVMARITHYSAAVKRMVGRMMIVEERQRPDFVDLDQEFNPGRPASPINQPSSPVQIPSSPLPLPQAPPERAEAQSVPQLVENTCSYCQVVKEVFPICHFICFECFAKVANQQARERKVKIICRCGTQYSPLMLSLVLDSSLYSS